MLDIPNKSEGDTYTDTEFDSSNTELKNLVTKSGQTLNGSNNDQVGEAAGRYASGGANFYTISGTANALLFGTTGEDFIHPSEYFEGMEAEGVIVSDNTGAVTANVNGIGVLDVKDFNGDALTSGLLITGNLLKLRYNSSNVELRVSGQISTVDIANDAVTTVKIAAGNVTLAKMDSAAVDQSVLKTTLFELSTATASSFVTGSGGEYGFWPNIKADGAGTIQAMVHPVSPNNADNIDANTVPGTTYLQRFHLGRGDGETTIFMQQRYIQASPPYDIGDGKAHTFIFAIVDNSSGNIDTLWHAPDPVWANNGPTCIRPEYERDGKLYRKVCAIDKSKGFEDEDRYCMTEQEITTEFKNSDMSLIPHPFQGNDLSGKSIILIDPNDSIVERAEIMKEAGESAIEELFMKEYVTIGNEHLTGRATPHKDIMVVKPAWKNSK